MKSHPRHSREHIHAPATFGERAADAVASGMGSWRFIGIQSCVIVVWITCNVVGFLAHWDAYPFILLNLLFSTQAAYAAPILQLSGNRQAQKDRMRDDHEASEVEAMFKLTQEIHEINKTQLEILTLLRDKRKRHWPFR